MRARWGTAASGVRAFTLLLTALLTTASSAAAAPAIAADVADATDLAGAAGAAGGASVPYATWAPQGRAVDGAARAADAPTLAPGATYRDALGPGGSRLYAVQLDGTSTAYLSVFALPRPGSAVSLGDGIALSLAAADGTPCDTYDARFGADGAAYPTGGYVERVISPYGQCQQPGRYLLSVRRIHPPGPGAGADAWPLEIRYMAEPGLRGGQPTASPAAPPPTPAGEPAPPGTSAARRVLGGSGIDDAAALPGTGTYRDHLQPGQSRFYRVPVDWGQRLQAAADFASAVATGPAAFTGSGVRLEIYNTARGPVGGDDGAYSGQPVSVSASTASVAYANRYSSDATVRASPFAGWYYIQLSLHPDVATYTTGGVDVALRVDLTGKAVPGPAYAGDAARAGFGVTVAGTAAARGGAAHGRHRSALLRGIGFAAIGVGTMLVMALAAWFVLSRWHPVDAALRQSRPLPPARPPHDW